MAAADVTLPPQLSTGIPGQTFQQLSPAAAIWGDEHTYGIVKMEEFHLSCLGLGVMGK